MAKPGILASFIESGFATRACPQTGANVIKKGPDNASDAALAASDGASDPVAGRLDTVTQLTFGVLDISRASDLATLFTLATLNADLYWQEDANGDCIGITHYSTKATCFVHDLPGRTLNDLAVAPDANAPAGLHSDWRAYRAARERFQPFRQVCLSIPAEDDGRFYLLVSGVPQHDLTGRFIGYHCLARDVTQERNSEQHQHRFREAIDMSMDMIYLVDRKTLRFIDINQTACEMTGLSREELLAMPPGDAMGFSAEELTARYDHLISTGASSRLERRLQLRDGRHMVVEIHSRAININNRWFIIGISRDVTSRKQAETRALHLQQMFSALSVINSAILRADDVDTLYDNVCQAGAASELFSTVTIMAPSQGYDFQIAAYAGQSVTDVFAHPVADPTLPEGRGLIAEAFREQRPACSNDYQNDDRTRPWHALAREQGTGSAAALPLFQRKECVAVIAFYATRRGLFNSEIVAILQSMAENINFRLDAFASAEEQARAAAVIRENEQRFRSLTTLSSDFYWEQDAELRFVKYEGRAIGDSNQQAIEDLIGRQLWQMSGVTPDSLDWPAFQQLLQQEKSFRDFEFSFVNDDGQHYHYALSGEPIFGDDGGFQGYRGISRDITEKKHVANRIKYLATHDTLTGLPNRVMFQELLRQTTLNARRYEEQQFAVLFLDLDQFKEVNDTYGHHTGDLLLAEVAQRLRAPLRRSDMVARLGGDEFVVILQRVSNEEQATQIAGNILRSLSEPLRLNGVDFHIGGSVGISLYGIDALDEDTLMNHADTAMYAAKESGPNQVRVYSSDLQQLSEGRASLSILLRYALERDELGLHYQAKVDIATGKVVGVEALLRWHHPELGDISPDVFIPLAEENGLIPCLGEWALLTGCRQVMAWQRDGLEGLTLAVNLSARQFSDNTLVADIRGILEETGFPGDRLELELTESLVAQSPERAITLIGALKQMGVRFALDDFGTGYSSLAQLRHYPLDTLKVDQTFIRNLTSSVEDQAISQAVISMASALQLTVVAEGVETSDQLELLAAFGCHQAQGSLYQRPSDADSFLAWYRQHNAHSTPGN